MRMWMCNPSIMCKNHLLGEHKEIHMLVGAIQKKKRLDNYIKNNCLELTAIESRHNELVEEFLMRGWDSGICHNSPIEYYDYSYLDPHIIEHKVNKEESLKDLITRCKECRNETKYI